MKKKTRILFVCLGNICRSAAAEGIAKSMLEKIEAKELIEIDSAATGRHTDGYLPDPRMAAHAARRGYRLTSQARPIGYSDFADFDRIVVMDDYNYRDVSRLAITTEDFSKISKMIDYCKKDQGYDYIPDPYYGGAEGFELVLDLLEDGIENLLNEILTIPSE